MKNRRINPRMENKNRTREIVSIGRALYISRHFDFDIRVRVNNMYEVYTYVEFD